MFGEMPRPFWSRLSSVLSHLEGANRSPRQNAWIESFNSRLRDEILNGELFDSLLEAQVILADWRDEYNRTRLHSSLGLTYMPPAEFNTAWKTRRRSASMLWALSRHLDGSSSSPDQQIWTVMDLHEPSGNTCKVPESRPGRPSKFCLVSAHALQNLFGTLVQPWWPWTNAAGHNFFKRRFRELVVGEY